MLIKLLKAWESHAAGTILNVTGEEIVKALIEGGIAEVYDPAANAKALEDEATAKAAQAAQIAEIVKAEVAAIVDKGKPSDRVTVVTDAADKNPADGFKSFGEFMGGVANAKTGKGFDPRLSKALLGQNETVDSEGGFLIPAEFRATLLEKTWAESQVASRCQTMPMSTNLLQIPFVVEKSRADSATRYGGVQAYWVAEGATITASQAAFGLLELKPKKLAAVSYASSEMLADSPISMEAIIYGLSAKALAFELDQAVIKGTGAGMPQGILNAPALVSVSKEAGQTATTLVTENLVKMWSRLHAGSRANAVWFINQDVIPQLMTATIAVGTAGQLTYMPPGGLSGAPYATLMGRPIVEIEHCSTLGTVGDVILADMSQYILAQKNGGAIDAQTSIHVAFLTDQSAFRFTTRMDGQSWWESAVTPNTSSANTLSPFVVLNTRA